MYDEFPECYICLAIYCLKHKMRFIKSDKLNEDMLCDYHVYFLKKNIKTHIDE